MSWQEYVNTQMVGKNLKESAIAGTDGNIWAKSTEFDIKPEEVQKLLKNFDEPSDLAATGINLGGQKYFYFSGESSARGASMSCAPNRLCWLACTTTLCSQPR